MELNVNDLKNMVDPHVTYCTYEIANTTILSSDYSRSIDIIHKNYPFYVIKNNQQLDSETYRESAYAIICDKIFKYSFHSVYNESRYLTERDITISEYNPSLGKWVDLKKINDPSVENEFRSFVQNYGLTALYNQQVYGEGASVAHRSGSLIGFQNIRKVYLIYEVDVHIKRSFNPIILSVINNRFLQQDSLPSEYQWTKIKTRRFEAARLGDLVQEIGQTLDEEYKEKIRKEKKEREDEERRQNEYLTKLSESVIVSIRENEYLLKEALKKKIRPYLQIALNCIVGYRSIINYRTDGLLSEVSKEKLYSWFDAIDLEYDAFSVEENTSILRFWMDEDDVILERILYSLHEAYSLESWYSQFKSAVFSNAKNKYRINEASKNRGCSAEDIRYCMQFIINTTLTTTRIETELEHRTLELIKEISSYLQIPSLNALASEETFLEYMEDRTEYVKDMYGKNRTKQVSYYLKIVKENKYLPQILCVIGGMRLGSYSTIIRDSMKLAEYNQRHKRICDKLSQPGRGTMLKECTLKTAFYDRSRAVDIYFGKKPIPTKYR